MGGVINTVGSLLGGGAGALGNAAGATSNFQAQLDPQTLAQQQAFVQALQAQMAGNGPSVAQNQLNQATSTNLSNAAGMAAAQRGVNPALAARQAQQAGAQMNQQAAGQAATLRAQEQLGAQNMLGNQLNTQQTQYLQTQGINANTASQNAQTQGQIVGGMLGGIGSAAGAGAKYNGGMVGYADGGAVQPRSSITNYLLNPVMAAAKGNTVPGQPLVPGDNPINDVVPAMLSPREIVIPNSITMGPNAGEAAKKFVEAELAKAKKKDSSGYADGGVVRADLPDIPEQGFLGQQVADDIRMAQNFRNAQDPSPLLSQENPVSNLTPDLTTVNPAVPEKNIDKSMSIPSETQSIAPIQSNSISTPVDTMGAGSQVKSLMNGIALQKAGLRQEAAATGALGQEQAKQIENQNQQMAARQAIYDKKVQDLDSKRQAFIQDIQEQKINPNQYYDNLSTGGKISTLVGLVLGGIGGGMTGKGGNMALDTFNNMVNRDIEAQKINLDKKRNLLTANMQELGNLKDAETMTRIMMNDSFANELKATAAKAQGPIAQARAQQMIGQLEQQNAQLMGSMAAKQAIQDVARGQKVNAEALPEDQRQRYIQTDKFSGLAPSKEEAVKFREQLPTYNSTVNGLKRLLEMGKDSGTAITPSKIAEAEQIKYLLAGTLREDVLGPGTVNESERKIMLDKILADPSKIFSMDSSNKTKIVNLLNNIEAKKADQAKTLGLNVQGGGGSAGNLQMNPTDKRIYEMAIKTPNSKNAKAALEILKGKYGI